MRQTAVVQQQKQPSSVNSSESESLGSNMQSGASADSQRSVYLHATTVADIPPAIVANQAKRRAQSREDVSKQTTSNISTPPGTSLRQSRQISRSYSVLAPWKPRHYREKYEISYSNQQQPAHISSDVPGKPPRPPRRQEATDTVDMDFKPPPPQQQRNAVARSSTMPKDSRLAGWFRKKKR